MDEFESQDPAEFIKRLSIEDKNLLKNCQKKGFFIACISSITCYVFRQAQSNLTKMPFTAGGLGTYAAAFAFGYLAYTPFCLSKTVQLIRSKRLEYYKRDGDFSSQLPVPIEENTSFQSTVNPDLDGPDSGFSHLSLDYNPNPADHLILKDEEEKLKPKFQTTYEDLRKENRKNYWGKDEKSDKSSPYPIREVPSTPTEPRKYVKTNQYGDPIEY